VAQHAHRAQYRKSGEPFITHPVEVTRILAEMRLDYESLISGLLHDTVEDTEEISFDSIEALFGGGVRRIVEGETKLSKIAKHSNERDDDKAKDLQGLFLAMTEDVRIIMVKLADRLHNMRTLYGMKPEKQVKIAQETLQVRAAGPGGVLGRLGGCWAWGSAGGLLGLGECWGAGRLGA
jgi:(p)ppGpp synthase/HD superfamily hydrolase